MTLFRRAGLARYENCLKLFQAYTAVAPLWERSLLAAYVGLGPPVARVFGGNTKEVWEQADSIIADLFAVSGMTAHEVVAALRQYVRIKKTADDHLPFAEACELIYDQSFYPLVTHFTFAFQSSAIARMRFVSRIAAALAFRNGIVADLGCGSGAMICRVLQAHPGWTGIGLDISRAGVDYARRLAELKGVARQSHFQQGTLSDLPFSSGSIQLVIASEVIEHVEEPGLAFTEIARVLEPGGFLVLTVPLESHTPAHINSVTSEEEFRSLCAEVGLTVQSIKSKWHLTFGDDARHLFAVAQLGAAKQSRQSHVYSLLPQMSSAASSGIVSS